MARRESPAGRTVLRSQNPRVRLSTRHLAEFTRQLATLLQARLPLARALHLLAEQQPNPKLRSLLHNILERIKAGQALSDALAEQRNQFSGLYLSLVRVGEQAGILDQTLSRLAQYLEKAARLQRKIITALTYPALIVVVAVAAIAFLLIAVVPTFADMFQDFGATLPGPTRFLLDAGEFVRDYGHWLFLSLTASILMGVYARKIERIASMFDRMLLRLPVIGSLLARNFLAKFCRTLGTLLQSGVVLVNALEVTQQISGNTVFAQAIRQMMQRIVRGESLLPADAAIAPFSRLTQQMIRVGEETGELGPMLIKVAQFYEDELDARIDTMTSVIEPIIIVFLGIVLGGTLVAMYLQMFELTSVIQ